MKRFFVFLFAFALIFSACDTSHNPTPYDPVVENPTVENPTPEDPSVDNPAYETPSNEIPLGTLIAPTSEEIAAYPRLSMVDSEGVWWLRRPVKKEATSAREIVYNIADGDTIAAYCTEPGWAYIFYDDQAVIGYEPFQDRVDVMQNAVKITVESHNQDKPNEEWGYINVAMPYTPPITSNDPVLDVWEMCFCLDNGTVVFGPITAEFEWEWNGWKSTTARLDLENYNRDHDPDAHIVWGPDA